MKDTQIYGKDFVLTEHLLTSDGKKVRIKNGTPVLCMSKEVNKELGTVTVRTRNNHYPFHHCPFKILKSK